MYCITASIGGKTDQAVVPSYLGRLGSYRFLREMTLHFLNQHIEVCAFSSSCRPIMIAIRSFHCDSLHVSHFAPEQIVSLY
jgi:hypothetical protein